MGTVDCPMFRFSCKARPSSPGFLRGPSGLQSEEILFVGAMVERAEIVFYLIWNHFNASVSFTSFSLRLFLIRSWSRNSLTSTWWYTPMYNWILWPLLKWTIILLLWVSLQLLLLYGFRWCRPVHPSSRNLYETSEALSQTYPEKVWLAPAKSCVKVF